ncbi:MAG: TetR/AcrR family transcriptional regulator [Thermoleophilia bacterium]
MAPRKSDEHEEPEEQEEGPPPARSLEPRRSDARRNKDRLLDAALRVLSENPDASMEEVAAEAELTRSTVYRRFAGRDELLQAIQARVVEETIGVFHDAVAQEPDFVPCLTLMFREAVRNTFERRRIWWHLARVGVIPQVGTYRPNTAWLEWLEAGQKAGAFRDDVPVGWLATVWIQLVNAGTTTVERDGIDLEDAAVLAADAAVQILTGGPSQTMKD